MAQFRFGSFDFPDRLIKWGAVNVSPNQRQDLNSYTDGFGVTQRNALAHTKTQIQFTTLPMNGSEMGMVMAGITSNYKNFKERDADCTYYDDESQEFKSGHFYLDPSLQFVRNQVDSTGRVTEYGEMQWTFIEY